MYIDEKEQLEQAVAKKTIVTIIQLSGLGFQGCLLGLTTNTISNSANVVENNFGDIDKHLQWSILCIQLAVFVCF